MDLDKLLNTLGLDRNDLANYTGKTLAEKIYWLKKDRQALLDLLNR